MGARRRPDLRLQSFETETLAEEENFVGLARINRELWHFNPRGTTVSATRRRSIRTRGSAA